MARISSEERTGRSAGLQSRSDTECYGAAGIKLPWPGFAGPSVRDPVCGGFFGVCRFHPPTPAPAFVRGAGGPRASGDWLVASYRGLHPPTFLLRVHLGPVSIGGLYECGCSPHGPRPPPSLPKRGRPRGSAGAPYSTAEGPVASTVAHFLRSRVPAWGHGEESGRRKQANYGGRL